MFMYRVNSRVILLDVVFLEKAIASIRHREIEDARLSKSSLLRATSQGLKTGSPQVHNGFSYVPCCGHRTRPFARESTSSSWLAERVSSQNFGNEFSITPGPVRTAAAAAEGV